MQFENYRIRSDNHMRAITARAMEAPAWGEAAGILLARGVC